jgi:phosphate transport system substrate-binding protein
MFMLFKSLSFLFATVAIFSFSGCTNESSTPTTPAENASTSTTNTTSTTPAPTPTASALEGAVKIDGSSTVFPISEAAASAFIGKYPKVDVTVGKKGTGGGFSEFVRGQIDVSDASRPIKMNELEECKKNGIQFIELPIAYDGIAVCVHKDNDWIKQLTIAQLQSIYSADSAVKTWKDLDATYPAEPIKIFMPGTDSGTFDFFKEVVVGKEGHIRSDVTPSEEDLVLVNGIASEKYGIGFFGASYYFENTDRIKALEIVDPKTNAAVAPTMASIESSQYAPLGRPLFIYVNIASIKRPEVKRFIEYYLDHAAEICSAAKCVRLDAEMYKKVKLAFEDRSTGSYFYDTDGKSRSGQLKDVYVEGNRIAME